MSRVSLKKDFRDGEILYGGQVNTNNRASELAINDNYEKILNLEAIKADVEDMTEALALKVNTSAFNEAIDSLNTTKANVSLVNTKADKTEVALKADKTELQAGLASKVDLATYTVAMNNKADAATVEAQLATKASNADLATKASKSELQSGLATKANVEDVATGLANKADKTYVDNKLATKVNTSTYNTDMAAKADKSTIGDLEDLETSDKSSIVEAINSVQSETIPIATTSRLGVVKPDGTTTTIDSDGTLHAVGGGGGTGGTTDYNALDNKPSINSVTLSGNKTLSDLGLMSRSDINSALNTKANQATTYTKTEVDTAISDATTGKADKSYVDTQLGTKVSNSTYLDGLATKVDTTVYNAGLATKADASTTYTKTEVDTAITGATSNKATTSYVDAQLANKADVTDVYDKDEVDAQLDAVESSMSSTLATKADAATTYTKTEVNTAISTAVADKATTTYVDTGLATKANQATTYTKTEVDNLITSTGPTGDTLPIGSVVSYSGQTTPENWLLCDGREVSRTVYSQLFNVIGTMYGPGDGSTSFDLPDLTGDEQNYIIKAKQSAGVVATVVDTLTSTSATDALSANQGRLLNNRVTNLETHPGTTLLFSGNITSDNTTVNLTDNITKYDFILFVTRADTGEQSLFRLNTTLVPIVLYNKGGANFNIPVSGSKNLLLNITSNTTLKTQGGFTQYFALMEVYGINL